MPFARALLAAALLQVVVSAQSPSAPKQQAATPLWRALETLDLEAARASAASDDERAFVTLVERAISGGAAEVQDDLAKLAGATREPPLRARATMLLLDMLRGEGRWEDLARLPAQWPALPLSAGYAPAALLALPREQVELPEAAIDLPMIARAGRHVIVNASLTGATERIDAPVLLDTGANLCVVTPALAKRLGVSLCSEATFPVIGITGARGDGRPGVLRELALGAFRVRNLPVAIVDLAELEPVLGEVGFLVGWEVLQHVALEVAARRGTVVLRHSTPDPECERNLILLDEPTVRVRSGAVSLLFLLDTGADATDVRSHVPALLDLKPETRERQTQAGVGGSSDEDVPVLARLPFALGKIGLELGNVGVTATAADPRDLLRIDGTLGIDLAHALRLVIDGPNRHVRLVVD